MTSVIIPTYPVEFFVNDDVRIMLFKVSDKHPPTTGTKLEIAYLAVFKITVSALPAVNPVNVKTAVNTVKNNPIEYFANLIKNAIWCTVFLFCCSTVRQQNLTFLSLLYLNRQKDNLKLLPI